MELNPFSYSFHEDPYPTYRWLRDEAPVYRNEELDFWALSRYADVLAGSRDHETYSSANGTTLEVDPEMIGVVPIMIFMDPPQQVRLRKLVNKVFTPRRIAELEPSIRALACRFLDPLVGRGSCDLVRDFSALLPIEVISTMLGVPESDRTQIREWSDQALHREPDDPKIPRSAIEASARSLQYWAELLAERRRRPKDDLLSGLLQAEVERDDGGKERLTDPEILGFCGLLAAAGNETVTKFLANAVVLLSRYPGEREKIVKEPARIPNAVEEILRYWPPSQYQGRTLVRDVELHGVKMLKDGRVLLLTGSACRDEREYPDADVFDIGREIPIALALGHGVHKCLGAALARLESRVCLEELHARIPHYEVDEAGLERVHMSNVHGFSSVPMSY